MSERRPISSRNTRWAEWVARRLARRGVSPNAISAGSLLAATIAGVAFVATAMVEGPTQRVFWMVGALFCQLRLLCNLFDGMVAIELDVASPLGELYNEVPDRISDAAIFVGLGYSVLGNPALGYLAALSAVFVAYVRVVATSIGATNDFCGPMAKQHRMAVVTVVAVYLACAPTAWRLPWSEINITLTIVIGGCAITSLRRLKRAMSGVV